MLLSLSAVLSVTGSASAETLVKWNLDGLSRPDGVAAEMAKPTFVHSSIKSSDLTIAMFIPTAWLDALTVYSDRLMRDLGSAIDVEHYYSFTVTPQKGKKISYESIFSRMSINTGDLSTGASIKFVLMSSATGFAPSTPSAPLKPLDSFTVTHPANNDKATTVKNTFELGSIKALQGINKPVEFRIYAILVDGVGNRMGIGHIFYQDGQDDLRVEGTVE